MGVHYLESPHTHTHTHTRSASVVNQNNMDAAIALSTLIKVNQKLHEHGGSINSKFRVLTLHYQGSSVHAYSKKDWSLSHITMLG